MKSIIALYLMTVLYLADASTLDMLVNQIKQSKRTVQNNIQQLERLRNNAERDTIFNIKNQQMEQMRRYIDYSNPTIDAIRKEVEAAKAEGKDAQPCYDTAFNTLRNVQNTITTDSQRCINSAESSIRSELNFINDFISTGYGLTGQLESIVPNCYSSNNLQMERCIVLKLAQVNVVMKSWQSEVNSAEYKTRSASNKVVLQGNNCIFNVYSPARSQVTEIRLAATKCLKAL